MGIIATSNGSTNYAPMEAGNYVARCYQMIHIGTVEETFNGETKMQNKVRISWETPTEKKVFKEENGEQPYSLSKEFTLSMHEKSTLRKFLEGWRGKAFTKEECDSFDISVLIGKPCMLNVIHKTSKQGKVFAEISSISSMPKGMKCDEQINKSVCLSYDAWDEDVFKALPDFIKDKMVTSQEYKQMTAPDFKHLDEPKDSDSKNEDDLPF